MFRLRALLPLLALAAPALAQEDEASLARLLPANTPLYVESLTPPQAELAKTAMGKVMDDPAMRAFMENLFAGGSPNANMVLGEATVRLAWSVDAGSFALEIHYADPAVQQTITMANRFAFAWVGMHRESPVAADLVAAIEVDKAPLVAIGVLERLVAAALNAVEPRQVALVATPGGDSIGDRVREVFTRKTHAGSAYSRGVVQGVPFYLVPAGKLVIVATSEARARDILDRVAAADPAQPSLRTDERYVALRESAPGGGTITTVLSLQVDRALAAVEELLPEQVGQARFVMTMLGLGDLRGITTVARVDGSGFSATTSVLLSGKRQGLARLFEGGEPATLAGLRFAPADSLYVFSGNCDLAALYEIATAAAATFENHEPSRMEEQFQRAFKLSLREDFLAHLGREMTLVVAPSRGLIPDIGIAFSCKNPKALERSLLGLLAQADFPAGAGVTTFKVDENEAHSVPMMHPDLNMVPLAPTMGVVDGHLLVTPYPMTFRRLAQLRPGADDITSNRDFKKLRARVPAHALDLSYLDLQRTYELLYHTFVPVLQSMPQPGAKGGNPLMEMPSAERVVEHLFGRIAWRTADEHGMHWHSHSAIDTSGVAMGALAGAGATGVLLVRAAPESEPEGPIAKAERALPEARAELLRCGHNVRVIRQRILLFEEDHGATPPSLDALRGRLPRGALIVPGAGGEEYVYLGPKPAAEVLLHGFPNGPDGGVTVLTVEKRILRVTPERLARMLGEK